MNKSRRIFAVASLFCAYFALPLSADASDHLMTIKLPGGFENEWSAGTFFEKGPKGFSKTGSFFGDSKIFHERNEIDFGNCNDALKGSLLGQAQILAIEKYLRTQYLSRDQVQQLLQSVELIRNNPISFFLGLSETPPKEKIEFLIDPATHPDEDLHYKFGYRTGAGTHPLAGRFNQKEMYVTASIFSVSGQKMTFSEAGPKVETLSLPWTNDEEFKLMAQYLFSRDKYPFVWEIGRAATNDTGGIRDELSAAAADILNQTMHYGVAQKEIVQHGYITRHVLNKENFDRLADPKSGLTILFRSEKNPYNAVFIEPLSHFLDSYSPSKTFFTEGSIRQAIIPSRQFHIETDIAAFLADAKLAGFQSIDFKYKGKFTKTPLVMNANTGFSTLIPIDPIAQKHGINPAQDVTELSIPAMESVHPHTIDPGLLASIQVKNHERWIQISNLDPTLAKDPEYVASAIVASFDHMARPFVQAGHSLEQFAGGLKAEGIRFLVTTNYESTSKSIQGFQPSAQFSYDLKNDLHANSIWEQLFDYSKGDLKRPSTVLKGYYFTIDQISQLRYMIYMRNGLDPIKIPSAQFGYFHWLDGMI